MLAVVGVWPDRVMDSTYDAPGGPDDYTSSSSYPVDSPVHSTNFHLDILLETELALRSVDCSQCGFLLLHPAEPCPLCSAEDSYAQTQDSNLLTEEQPQLNNTENSNIEENDGITHEPVPRNIGPTGNLYYFRETINPQVLANSQVGGVSMFAQPLNADVAPTLNYKAYRDFDLNWNEISHSPKRKLSEEECEDRRRKRGKICQKCKKQKKKCSHWSAGGPCGAVRDLDALWLPLSLLCDFIRKLSELRITWLEFSPLKSISESAESISESALHRLDDFDTSENCPNRRQRMPLLNSNRRIMRVVGLISHGRGSRWTTLRFTLFAGGQFGIV